ncbi:hypothetical protein [Emticicia agri]|uniref:Uncharacterized protein n=1 Tax=Emticicia agri TaxID=2492393 RepID=A0A4Q5LUP5_9BACT|nr:hypothetical protein [Emticicia agri]RYU93217.1 hypothetical protein EWM59_23050 [Emticicia agri]
MKMIFTFTLCTLCYFAHAQQPCPPDVPYKETAYHILKNLDKSQIPTGVLYENVLPLANIYQYTGNSNTDTSNTAHFCKHILKYTYLHLSM